MTDSKSTLATPFQEVHTRIQKACQASGLNESRVRLLAVSKTFGPQAVFAAIARGQCDFGENYVQEAVEKRQAVQALLDRAQVPLQSQTHDETVGAAGGGASNPNAVHWHFIGPLQSNKTRDIAETMDWIHSIDRLKIAQRLIDQRPPKLAPLQACLQINISKEANKSGIAPGEESITLALAVSRLDPKGERLRLRGLMAIPKVSSEFNDQRHWFNKLRELKRTINQSLKAEGYQELDVLSMGMSADLEAAVAESEPDEGFTWLRVGSALFGTRASKTG